MNTGELLIDSITKSDLAIEQVIKLALTDMNTNIISAQLETEKYPIEDLERMSTAELITLIGILQARLRKIQSYIGNIATSQKETQRPSVEKIMDLSSTLVGMIITFEEVLMTHFELGKLQETYSNILRILKKRNNDI